MDTALDGLRVLDLSESVAGQFCGRMLADYGGDVTLLEPPGGSLVRAMPPFDPVAGDSLLFFHLNLGKRSIVLDPATADGRALLLRLLGSCDVVIVGGNGDVDALRDANPAAIVCVVSPFGQDGPWRNWQGAEIVYQALSGMMNHNGIASKEPLYGCGQRSSHAAGLAAYVAVLAALHARPTAGGQVVSVDIAETASAMWYPYTLIHAFSGWLEPRGERGQPVGQVQGSDGDWACFWVKADQWGAVCAAIGRPELAEDGRFVTYALRQRNWRAAIAYIQEAASTMTANEFVSRWQARRLICARAFRLTELWDSPHLRERGFWETVATEPEGRPILGPQFRMSATPRRVRGGAPALASGGAA